MPPPHLVCGHVIVMYSVAMPLSCMRTFVCSGGHLFFVDDPALHWAWRAALAHPVWARCCSQVCVRVCVCACVRALARARAHLLSVHVGLHNCVYTCVCVCVCVMAGGCSASRHNGRPPLEEIREERGMPFAELISRCWSARPGDRPCALDIVQQLEVVSLWEQTAQWQVSRLPHSGSSCVS